MELIARVVQVRCNERKKKLYYTSTKVFFIGRTSRERVCKGNERCAHANANSMVVMAALMETVAASSGSILLTSSGLSGLAAAYVKHSSSK